MDELKENRPCTELLFAKTRKPMLVGPSRALVPGLAISSSCIECEKRDISLRALIVNPKSIPCDGNAVKPYRSSPSRTRRSALAVLLRESFSGAKQAPRCNPSALVGIQRPSLRAEFGSRATTRVHFSLALLPLSDRFSGVAARLQFKTPLG
jgi:hypothetical protein